jgi:glycerol-3-phosphate dehydrogenase
VFLVPWRDYTLVGVWHLVHTGNPDEFCVSREELQAYIDEINAADCGIEIRLDEVSMVYAGLTLFGENAPGQKNLHFGHRSMLIDHEVEHDLSGLVTLIGVRATTARGLAEKAVDLVLKKMGKHGSPSSTETTPIFGGNIGGFENLVADVNRMYRARYEEKALRSLVHNYGSAYRRVLEYGSRDPQYDGVFEGTATFKSEVMHAMREEMALTLSDLVFRRTDLGTGGYPGEDVLREGALMMAGEFGWDRARVDDEVAKVRSRFPN